jgi:hypothetical protein
VSDGEVAAAGAAGQVRGGPTVRQNQIFFGLTLALFLVSRLWGLERFPIFFFCDEAVQTVQAARLSDNGFRGEDGELLPTYFRNTEFFNLSIGVYLQVLPEKLFGRSVFVARAVPAIVLLTAMLAVGLILRDFLGLRFYWAGVLALSVFPGWFLHTRIAFELMLAAAAYVWFLYFYLRYRSGRPRSLFAAALFGALTFYGYNTFQPVIVGTALLLAVTDAVYHWKNRKTVALAVLFLAVLALPYVRFLRAHSRDVGERLRSLDSYWTDPGLSLPGKLRLYGTEWLRGYSPRYWFFPEPPGDIGRHMMKGYAHVPLAALPFIAAGVLFCVFRIRSPGPRTLLVALAAAPLGGAIVRSGITRAMTLVVVFGMLVGVAADPALRLLSRRIRPVLVAAAVWAGLAFAQVAMLADALVHGPTWYPEYGLYGMQWGAREVFGEVARLRAKHPTALILVSPDWANGMGDLLSFFIPRAERITIANLDWLRYERRDVPAETLAVLTEAEYQSAAADRRFEEPRVETTIPYPDGRPGFRFAWLRYSPDFEAVLAAEKEGFRRLVTEQVEIGGSPARVAHSIFDVGQARHLFDGEDRTLVRTESANPAVVSIELPQPRNLTELVLTLGSMQCEIAVAVSGPSGQASVSNVYRDLPLDPTVRIALPAIGGPIAAVRIAVRDVNAGEPQKVHLREIRLQ